MSKQTLNTWSATQAVVILAVDNIKLSDFGYDVLKRSEDGLISYEQAKEEVLSRARAMVAEATALKSKIE